MKSLSTQIKIGLLAIILSSSANAGFITGYGGTITATGGDVTVEVLHSSSGYYNRINFFPSFPDESNAVFVGIDNYLRSLALGTFSAGTELVFGITNHHDTYFMGDGSRNSDGIIHAFVKNLGPSGNYVERVLVGFEDLPGGGDNDFNDVFIRVSQTAAVPAPETLGIMLLGLSALVLRRSRKI